MVERPPIDIDTLAEQIDAEMYRGKGGGGGKKKKESWGREGRMASKQAETQVGQRHNRLMDREGADKAPVEEIKDVLGYVLKRSRGSSETVEFKEYISWLFESINNPDELLVDENECGGWKKFTSSVHAGGSGRQTSRNARARRHLITGIRAAAELSRKANGNEKRVMKKMEIKAKKHIDNWRMVLGIEGEVTRERVEEAVLELITLS